MWVLVNLISKIFCSWKRYIGEDSPYTKKNQSVLNKLYSVRSLLIKKKQLVSHILKDHILSILQWPQTKCFVSDQFFAAIALTTQVKNRNTPEEFLPVDFLVLKVNCTFFHCLFRNSKINDNKILS